MKSLEETLETACGVLKIESQAVEQLQKFIDKDFYEIVKIIYQTKGRLVITGIGKSAIIANKIVATLNSTGTPSIFMHAADAIHGDLGIIQKDDIVLCISHSGNTPEIKLLVPWLKEGGNILIGMTGNTQSFLAEHSDHLLNASIDQEACPNNLAPTTSTTVQLALGDALAVCLLSWKDFSANDFAKYHPGGALGKKLYLRVGELSAKNEKPCVAIDATLDEVILEITSRRLGATVVLANDGTIAGMITDGDLRRLLYRKDINIHTLTAKEIMSLNPKNIEKDELAVSALEIIRQNKITQIIVTDQGKYFGMVHIHDLNKEGLFF